MVNEAKIKNVRNLSLDFDGIKILPKPDCKKCYGRGYAAFDRNSDPIPCQCLRKQWAKLKAQRTSEGTAKSRENIQAQNLFEEIEKMDCNTGQTMGMNLEDIRDQYPAQWQAAMQKLQGENPARYKEIMDRMAENDKHKAEQLQKGVAERSINDECRKETASDQGLPGEGVPTLTENQGG